MSLHKVYLYVTPFFPRPGSHYGSYSYDFVKNLKAFSEYEVTVFVPGDGTSYRFKDVIVHTFKTRQLPSSIFPLIFAKHNIESFLSAVSCAGVDTGDVAVCHCNTAPFSIYANAIKRLSPRCKTLLHHHDLASCGLLSGRLRHLWIHKIINWVMLRTAMEKIDAHIFISNASRQSFLRFPDTSWSVYEDYQKLGSGMHFLRPAKIRKSFVLRNGVDRQVFNLSNRNNATGFCVGCSGIYWPIKDHISLMRAIALLRDKIPNLKLRMLGIPVQDAFGRKIITEYNNLSLKDIATFEPWKEHDRTASFYKEIDLFVLPCYFEGFGCVYTESWACGTPFIACEDQGVSDVIPLDEQKYWLCKPKNPEDLAQKIYGYYKNRKEQRLVGTIFFPEVITELIQQLETL